MVRVYHMILIQLQRPDKGRLKFREEMKGTAKKGYMPPNGLAAGKAADGLVYHRLKDGGGQILLGSALVDQGLDVGFGKDTAPGRNGIEGVIAFGVFVETGCVGLQEGCHLVDEGAGAACTDSVHPLFHIASLKIDDLGILASELDSHVGSGSELLESRGYADDLLYKGHLQVIGQRKSAGAGDHGMKGDVAKLPVSLV